MHYKLFFLTLFLAGKALPMEKAHSLILAVQHNDPEKVDQLITANYPIDEIGLDGQTPLMEAVEKNNYPIFIALLRAGAHANSARADGNSPLLLAATQPDPQFTQELLKCGADPKKENLKRQSVLYLATLKNNRSIIDLLLKYNAPINGMLEEMAIKDENTIYLSLLIEKSHVHPTRLLNLAIANNKERIVDHLFKIDPKPSVTIANLYTAISMGNAAIVQLVLGAGVDPNNYRIIENHTQQKIGFGCTQDVTTYETPLSRALSTQNKEVINKLVKVHANPNQIISLVITHHWFGLWPVVTHETVLSAACKMGNPELVRILLPHCSDANLEFTVSQGTSPSHLAVKDYLAHKKIADGFQII